MRRRDGSDCFCRLPSVADGEHSLKRAVSGDEDDALNEDPPSELGWSLPGFTSELNLSHTAEYSSLNDSQDGLPSTGDERSFYEKR
ncbi:MAG: hypothetical protein K0S45_3508 [Nitrospira sp.]|jgi:hypothetical protein|nr:hypothetical protein [Nitrospira sp.]